MLLAVATGFFGTLIAGQLSVAATAKVSGVSILRNRLGRYRRLAGPLIGVELVLSALCAASLPSSRVAMTAAAVFFGLGAIHRAHVVLSPLPRTCLCAHPGTDTTWSDVAANVIMAGAAMAFAAVGARPPLLWSAANLVMVGSYVALWLRSEVVVRRARQATIRGHFSSLAAGSPEVP